MQHTLVPQKADIDFTRHCIGIAFLKQRSTKDASDESVYNLETALDENTQQQHAWRGTFGTIVSVIRSLLIDSYSQKRRYSHCEVCFFLSEEGEARFGNQFMISCGTREDTGVKIVARHFNQNYKWLYVNVTQQELHYIVEFLFAQNDKRYDTKASLRVFTSPRATNGRRWYCSELVLCALQLLPCPKLHEHRANCTEVDDVHTIIKRSPRMSTSPTNMSPYQINRAYENFDLSAGLFGGR